MDQYIAALERRLASIEDSVRGLELGTRVQICRATRINAQSILDSVLTAITFEAVRFDPFNMWDPANPTRVNILRTGIALLFGQLVYAGNGTGDRQTVLRVTTPGGGNVEVAREHVPALPSGTAQRMPPAVTAYPVSAGQYVEMYAQQVTAPTGALNVNPVANHSPDLTVVVFG